MVDSPRSEGRRVADLAVGWVRGEKRAEVSSSYRLFLCHEAPGADKKPPAEGAGLLGRIHRIPFPSDLVTDRKTRERKKECRYAGGREEREKEGTGGAMRWKEVRPREERRSQRRTRVASAPAGLLVGWMGKAK